MRIGLTWRQALRMFVYTTLIRALVLPVPVFAADLSAPLVAPLADGVKVSADGRILNDVPTTPVTQRGQRRAQRTVVPRGTKFRILATAYSSTPDQTDSSPFITASGTRVHDGTVAANFLPFGTKVRFANYRPDKVFTVEDRHHPRLTSRVDLWFTSRAAALQFGARVLQMEVVD